MLVCKVLFFYKTFFRKHKIIISLIVKFMLWRCIYLEKEIKELEFDIKFYGTLEIILTVLPLIITMTAFVLYRNAMVFGGLVATTMFALEFGKDKKEAQKELNQLLKEVKKKKMKTME